MERLIAANNHVHLYYYILPLYLQTGIVIFLLRDMKKFVREKLRKLPKVSWEISDRSKL